MSETFSDVVSRLNAPVVLDLNNSNPPDQGKTDGNSADKQFDLTADDPYGLVARVAASRSNLPMHMTMKLAGLAIIDLKVAVKYSRLGEESKNLLVEHLEIFHSTAKAHSRKLQFLETRSKGCIDGQVVRNVFLSAKLDRLAKMMPEGRVGVWGRIRNAFSFGGKQDVKVASTKTKLRQLYAKTFKEGQKQLRMLILQIQDLQQGLDDMEQTRWSIIDIMGRERGEQERLQDESLAEVWRKVGKTHFEQDTYSKNLALLKGMEKQQQMTGGDLEWIRGKLTGFEGEMEVLWERMVEARVVEAEKDKGREGSVFERAAKGAAGVSTPLSDHLTGDQGQTSYSFQDEIQQIQSEIDKLKAKQASKK
ncbi:hypothetical protein BGX24_006186 [Mortierella sp. AD032]|nr:hypothetical protein BGX24_006186 [Mortierella sp. AD032]